MKPFDFEKALAGDPVVTRNGIEVILVLDASKAVLDRPVLWCSSLVQWHNSYENGKFTTMYDDKYDLFMAPTKMTYYYNIVSSCANIPFWYRYFSKQEAIDASFSLKESFVIFHHVAVPLEVEE